jgi:hypothetical protein
MAHFSESLCEEVIRTEGECGLTRNEMVQMARFALRAIRNENPLLRDALRYRYMRSNAAFQDRNGPGLYWYLPRFNRDLPLGERLDAAIDDAMSGRGPEAASLGP